LETKGDHGRQIDWGHTMPQQSISIFKSGQFQCSKAFSAAGQTKPQHRLNAQSEIARMITFRCVSEGIGPSLTRRVMILLKTTYDDSGNFPASE